MAALGVAPGLPTRIAPAPCVAQLRAAGSRVARRLRRWRRRWRFEFRIDGQSAAVLLRDHGILRQPRSRGDQRVVGVCRRGDRKRRSGRPDRHRDRPRSSGVRRRDRWRQHRHRRRQRSDARRRRRPWHRGRRHHCRAPQRRSGARRGVRCPSPGGARGRARFMPGRLRIRPGGRGPGDRLRGRPWRKGAQLQHGRRRFARRTLGRRVRAGGQCRAHSGARRGQRGRRGTDLSGDLRRQRRGRRAGDRGRRARHGRRHRRLQQPRRQRQGPFIWSRPVSTSWRPS